MVTALVAVSMFGYGLALHRRCHWPVEAIPFVLAALAIDGLYVAGLMKLLGPGAYVLVAVGVGLAVTFGCRLRIRGHRLRHVSPGIVACGVLVVAVCWKFQGASFWGFDEFSHWGLTSKSIIETDALIGRDSPVIFKDYPPGAALFHYLLTLGHGFSEVRAYVAHALLALVALTALCVGLRTPAVAAVLTFGYFGLFALGRGTQTLDVDHIVALFFGCGLGTYLVSTDKGRLARVIPVVFALPLLKSVGLLFAVCMVCAVIADQLLAGRPSRRQIILMIVLVSAPIVASQSWRAHVNTIGAKPTFSLAIAPGRVLDSFSSDRSSPRDRATRHAFGTALTSEPVGSPRIGLISEGTPIKPGVALKTYPGLSVAAWTLIIAVFAAALVALQPNTSRMRSLLSLLLWLALCGVVYGSGLLVLYLNSFSEYEGTRLASFSRYFGILFFGFGLVTLSCLLLLGREPAWRGRVGGVLVVLVTSGMIWVAPLEAVFFARRGADRVAEQRKGVQEAMHRALSLTGADDALYIVWQGSKGFELYVARYEAAPRNTNSFCWSLGSARFEGDVWTCQISPALWAAILRDFDFVVLARVDPAFWDEFGSLFPAGRESTVFKVEKLPWLRLIPQ